MSQFSKKFKKLVEDSSITYVLTLMERYGRYAAISIELTNTKSCLANEIR